MFLARLSVPLDKVLSLGNTKENRLFFCISLAYPYLCIVKRLYIIYIIIMLTGCVERNAGVEKLESFSKLLPGDLLFVVSPRANGITDVTQGYDDAMIDHVAIYAGDSIIEAVPRQGVRMTSLNDFLEQNKRESSRLHLLVGRVSRPFDAARSLQNARAFVGMPYDSLFLSHNRAVYCSELVVSSYVDEAGQWLFGQVPMSFHDTTGTVTPYWKQFYGEHGMEVPEGQPGSNPGELSRRPSIQILYSYEL